MSEELKPCPFCGGKAKIIIFSAEYGTVTVGCTNEECDITMGKAFFTDEEAIRHWNRRVNDETDWRRQTIRADKIVKAGATNWRLHNTIPKDRYKPTLYTEEKSQIGVKPNGAYTDDRAKMVSMSTIQSSTPRTKNTFNKFSQRGYTDEQFKEMERKIIQKGDKDGG